MVDACLIFSLPLMESLRNAPTHSTSARCQHDEIVQFKQHLYMVMMTDLLRAGKNAVGTTVVLAWVAVSLFL
jgi:hypothetical protein